MTRLDGAGLALNRADWLQLVLSTSTPRGLCHNGTKCFMLDDRVPAATPGSLCAQVTSCTRRARWALRVTSVRRRTHPNTCLGSLARA